MSGRPSWREQLRRLAEVRIAGTQLALLVTLSLSGTALVIAGALAQGPPTSALAALAQRGVVVHRQAAQTTTTTTSDSTPTDGTTARTSHKHTPTNSDTGEDTTPDTSSDDPTEPTHTPTKTPPSKAPPKGTKIKHVFVIALTSSGYDATFGTAAATSYLVHDLVPKGALLTQYHVLDDAGADLPNGIALASGQPPNAQTQQECPTFSEFPASATPGSDGAIAGDGCVYPVNTLTVADQLGSAGRSWRAYVQGTGAGKTCRRPAFGAPDDTLALRPEDPYATRHNPFAYFHSLLDLGDCQTNDVDLDDALTTDLSALMKTPNLSVIVPDLCHDGSTDPCVAGQPGGSAAADAFLAAWVPKILASPAYQQDGLLIVTFGGVRKTAPSTSTPAATTPTDPAELRRVGTLLVSRWTKPGTTIDAAGDPYALLRTIEDLFGLTHLARAGGAEVHSFSDVALGTAG